MPAATRTAVAQRRDECIGIIGKLFELPPKVIDRWCKCEVRGHWHAARLYQRSFAGYRTASRGADPPGGLNRAKKDLEPFEVDRPLRRKLLAPFRKRLRRRQAIEAVVDFDRVECQRVVRKPAGRGELSRVEITPPVGLLPARTADGECPGASGLTTWALRGRALVAVSTR